MESDSNLSDSLKDFIDHCTQFKVELDAMKEGTENIINQAYVDLIDPIRPARFLLEKNVGQNKMIMSGEMVDEMVPEDAAREEIGAPTTVDSEADPSTMLEGQSAGCTTAQGKEDIDMQDQEDEEDEESASSDEDGVGEAFILVNNRQIAIWEYLGNDWSKDIVSVSVQPS